MEYEISKELFKSVYGDEYSFRLETDGDEWYLIMEHEKDGEDLREIHIDTFAFKCKEWARNLEYELVSSIRDRAICDIYSHLPTPEYTFYSYTEQQSIFNACQWILENKE